LEIISIFFGLLSFRINLFLCLSFEVARNELEFVVQLPSISPLFKEEIARSTELFQSTVHFDLLYSFRFSQETLDSNVVVQHRRQNKKQRYSLGAFYRDLTLSFQMCVETFKCLG
jgi:hypothetical protein